MIGLYDYHESIRASAFDFWPLLFAAIRNADTGNRERLQAAFPEAYAEFWARFDAPGGLLPGERGMIDGLFCERRQDGNVWQVVVGREDSDVGK